MSKSVLFFLVIAFAAPAVSGAEDARAGKITGALGLVKVRKIGVEKSTDVALGDSFSVGDLLQTGKESAAQLTFDDGSFMELSPDTSVRVALYIYEHGKKDSGPGISRKKSVIKLIEGRARFIVLNKEKGTSLVRVETDHALIEVAAADFIVDVMPDETEIVVLDKVAKVSNISFLIPEKIQLLTNQRTAVRKKLPPSKPAAITPQQRKIYTDSNLL